MPDLFQFVDWPLVLVLSFSDAFQALTSNFVQSKGLFYSTFVFFRTTQLCFQFRVEKFHVFESAFSVPCWSGCVRIARQVLKTLVGGMVNLVLCGNSDGSCDGHLLRLGSLRSKFWYEGGSFGARWLILQGEGYGLVKLRRVWSQTQGFESGGQGNGTKWG